MTRVCEFSAQQGPGIKPTTTSEANMRYLKQRLGDEILDPYIQCRYSGNIEKGVRIKIQRNLPSTKKYFM